MQDFNLHATYLSFYMTMVATLQRHDRMITPNPTWSAYTSCLHTGHEPWSMNHLSTQGWWKVWEHFGNFLTVSPLTTSWEKANCQDFHIKFNWNSEMPFRHQHQKNPNRSMSFQERKKRLTIASDTYKTKCEYFNTSSCHQNIMCTARFGQT